MDQDIFTLVSHTSDKEKIFDELCKYQTEILVKGDSSQLHRLKPLVRDGKKNQIKCTLESSEHFESGEAYLGHFFLNEEKYYFKYKAHYEGDYLIIPFEVELYHLQRRQTFRVRIPESYPTAFNVIELAGKPSAMRGKLRDFSSQGAKLILPAPLSPDMHEKKIYGQLIIKDFPPLELRGIIRHVQERPALIGIEFSPLSSQLEAKLFSLSLELHKQLFK